MLRVGMGLHDRLALDVAVFEIRQPQDVHFDTRVTSATTGCMCCGIPGVVWRAITSRRVSISAAEMACPRRSRAQHSRPSTSNRSRGCYAAGQPHVVEHGAVIVTCRSR